MENKASHNKYRFARARANRVKGLKIANAIDAYLEKVILTESQKNSILKFREDLRKCSSYSLFRIFGKDAHYLHSLTCKHKLCPVCNADRKTRLRNIYRKFFEINGDLLENYDFMHLTLTVPHTANGWRDSQVYNQEIVKAFNIMRKYDFWKDCVYGGEATVEFTRDGKTNRIYETEAEIGNGLHIHIHALLLVKKETSYYNLNGSRNFLNAQIMKTWNNLTIWEGAKRKSFSPGEIAGIKRSLCGAKVFRVKGNEAKEMIQQAEKVVKALHPQGSTFMNLENLYVVSKAGKKIRCNGKDVDSLMKGIIECLKYHFEPVTIYSQETGYDIGLIMDMLPVIYKKRLYFKFGKFYGDKRLNINFEKDVDLGEIADTMNEEIINPDTGLPAQSTDFQYSVYDLSKTYLDKNNRIKFMGEQRLNLIGTFTDAFSQMKQITKNIVVSQSAAKRQNIAIKIAEMNYLLDTETGEIIEQNNVV